MLAFFALILLALVSLGTLLAGLDYGWVPLSCVAIACLSIIRTVAVFEPIPPAATGYSGGPRLFVSDDGSE